MYKKLLSQIYIFILFHRNFICPDKSYGKKQVVRIKTTFSTAVNFTNCRSVPAFSQKNSGLFLLSTLNSSLQTSTPFGGFREKSRASGTRDGYRSLARSLAACFDHLFKKRVFLGGRIIIRFPFIYRLRQSTMKRNRHEAPRKGEENQLTPVVLC